MHEHAHQFILQIIATRMAFRQSIQRMLKRNNAGMTFEMLQIMHCLWNEEGVSQQHLAEKTAKDKACLSNLINNLEKKNWVIRKEDLSDKRNRLVFLTDQGRELSGQIRPLLNNIYAQIASQINDKQLQAGIGILSKLNKILDEI